MANHLVFGGILKNLVKSWNGGQVTSLTQTISQFVLEQSRIVVRQGYNAKVIRNDSKMWQNFVVAPVTFANDLNTSVVGNVLQSEQDSKALTQRNLSGGIAQKRLHLVIFLGRRLNNVSRCHCGSKS